MYPDWGFLGRAAFCARSSFFLSRSAAFCAREAPRTGLRDSAVVQGRARGKCAGVQRRQRRRRQRRQGSTCLLSLGPGLLRRELAIELAERSLNGLGLGRIRRLARLAILSLGLLRLGLLGLQVSEVQLLHLRELRRNTSGAR